MTDIAAEATPAPAAKPETDAPLLTARHAWLVALLGIALFMLTQAPYVRHTLNLTFPDSDDIMRLLSVRDLLAGQSWFDPHQYRYLPPEGVAMHLSRLADAPLAALIFVLTPLLGAEGAEAVTALVFPPFLFLLYLAAMAFALNRLSGAWAAAIGVVIAGQSVVFASYIFRVGRIDHHALQILLVTVAALFFTASARSRIAPIFSGLFCALSLAIGLETLPFVAAIAVLHTLIWTVDTERRGELLRFAASFALAALAAFAIQTSPKLWLQPTCDTLSAPWLTLAVGGAVIAFALTTAGPRLRTVSIRLAAAAAGGAGLVALFAWSYPACLAGPYEMVPEPYRAIWLGDILEAQPAWTRLIVGSDQVFRAFGPLAFAAVAAIVLALHSSGATQRLFIVSAAGLSIGVVVSLFQVRGVYIASGFVPLVGALTVQRLFAALGEGRGVSRQRIAAVAFASLGFLALGWAIPAAALRTFVPQTPSKYVRAPECLLKEYLSRLDQLPQGLILAPIDLGAYTLLYTRHSIVAAGFHRAAEGIIASIDAFKGSEADMRRTATAQNADYIVVCKEWAEATPGEPFSKALVGGATVLWLERVPLDAGGSLFIWRVRQESRSTPGS